jgi:sterol desaturase/sphingolipid hydroxylase (fatty acid hydroxylase superfamily)
VHRALHLPSLWRFHKWHHSPTHMSWLAGNRETLVDRVLVTFPYLHLWPLLEGAPGPAVKALIVFSLLKNDWMHLNVTWRLPWLERIFITPRAHHLHHSADPAHFTKNLSPVFSLWDRLFRTWLNPEKTTRALSFGIGEDLHPARLITGV